MKPSLHRFAIARGARCKNPPSPSTNVNASNARRAGNTGSRGLRPAAAPARCRRQEIVQAPPTSDRAARPARTAARTARTPRRCRRGEARARGEQRGELWLAAPGVRAARATRTARRRPGRQRRRELEHEAGRAQRTRCAVARPVVFARRAASKPASTNPDSHSSGWQCPSSRRTGSRSRQTAAADAELAVLCAALQRTRARAAIQPNNTTLIDSLTRIATVPRRTTTTTARAARRSRSASC